MKNVAFIASCQNSTIYPIFIEKIEAEVRFLFFNLIGIIAQYFLHMDWNIELNKKPSSFGDDEGSWRRLSN